MRQLRHLVILGISTYLLVLLITFPASVALRWFAPDDFAYISVSGSAWSGDVSSASIAGVPLGRVQWTAHPLSLFTASIDVTASIQRSQSQFLDVRISLEPGGTTRLSNLRGVLALSTLGKIVPAAGYNGDLTLNLDELVLVDGWPVDAKGTLGLGNLTVIAPIYSPLGTYEVIFRGAEGDALNGLFTTIDGPLDAEGTVTLKPDRSFEVMGVAGVEESASADLKRMVQFIGPQQADGRHEFAFSGSI